MSTKTTLKRIALVAVSALGFGVLATTSATAAEVYTTSITSSASAAPVAGANGAAMYHTIRFNTSTTAAVTVEPNVILTSKPSTSGLALSAITNTLNAAGEAELSLSATNGDTAGNEAQATDCTTSTTGGYTYSGCTVYLHAYYDVAGTYVWTIFDDQGVDDGIVNGTDFATTLTVVVASSGAAQSYTGTLSVVAGASTVTSGDYGALVKVGLKDAAGNAAAPDTTGGVKVTVSGTGKVARVWATSGWVNNDDSSTYILGAGNFDGSGNAYFNVTNATSETVVISLSGSGSMASSFTAPSAVTVTTAAESASCTTTACTVNEGAATGLQVNTADAAGTDGAADANVLGGSLSFATGAINTGTSAYKDALVVTDTNGAITGKTGAIYNLLISAAASDSTATYKGTFSITPTWNTSIVGQTFTIQHTAVAAGADTDVAGGMVVTSEAAAVNTVAVSSADDFKAATGATLSFTVLATNQFGVGASGVAVTASIAGRNSTVNVASAITNADGYAVLSYKDASTSTTSLVDTITFSSNSKTDTATITYTTATNFGASSILLTSAVTKSTGADADVLSGMYWDIKAGAAGAQAGAQAVTATVKDASSVVLAGVPVTFTATGDGCAILSTKKTVYTGAAGTASTSVYGWLTGKCVVTGTVGTVTDDVNTYWSQQTAEEVRTFTAVNSSPRVITVTAKDRFGNVVLAAPFTATITAGDGFFGTGTNVATGSTDSAGILKFNTLESETALTVRVQAGNPASATYGQTDASATLVASVTATDVFDDVVAGTALEAEEGVGNVAAYTAAGNNIVDVTVAATQSAATTAAEAASDAAAEAIDAANAATDAANLAAEAADAATVAAEEARDAADAATAAVEELATQVATLMAALKAQITTLANTVAKIAKKVKA